MCGMRVAFVSLDPHERRGSLRNRDAIVEAQPEQAATLMFSEE